MINGLGLFAALGSPEPDAAPPPQAGDPALFAAALVAALGLKQPVQVVEPVDAPVMEQEVPAEGDDASADGETPIATQVVSETEEPQESAPVIHARVTPDAEAEKESKTLGAVLRAAGKHETPKTERVEPNTKAATDKAPVKGKIVDRISEEPALPANEPVTGKLKPGKAVPVVADQAQAAAADKQVASATTEAEAPLKIYVIDSEPAAETAGADAPKVEKKRSVDDAELKKTALLSAEHWSAPQDAAPMILPPAPQTLEAAARSDAQSSETTSEHTAQEPMAAPRTESSSISNVPLKANQGSTPNDSLRAEQGSATRQTDVTVTRQDSDGVEKHSAPVVPPQSNEERTSRAIAENTRLGRQLAEILGEAEVTEFKVQLAPRRASKTPQATTPATPKLSDIDDAPAPVVWQRVLPTKSGDTISGQMLPQEPGRSPRHQAAPEGTFAREAIVPQPLIQQGQAEGITLSGVTSRSEIVRMVANASRAISPNLAQTEATPAVAKQPAPSITPSLPVGRQELPDAEPVRAEASGEDPKQRAAREADASDASSSTSAASANYSTANTPRGSAPDTRDVREARNLPSHGSTDEPAAGSADRVTLQVADDEGRQTRIRVSVTGNQIRAVITPPDNASARQLEQRMDQLHETLVRQGFADPKLVIRSAPESVSDAATMASAAQGSHDVRSAGPAGKDQPAGDQRQGRGQGQREQDRGDGHRHPQGHSRERDPRDRRR